MNESATRNRPVKLEISGLPEDYIKVKYNAVVAKDGIDMAGFEAGDPTPKVEVDSVTGKRKFVVRLNGFVHIDQNGNGLILKTIFNLRKLRILTRPGTIKKPTDSTGDKFKVVETRPMFDVEDESIFDGIEDSDAPEKAATKKPGKAKGLKSVAEVEAEKAAREAEKTDNADGLGGGRQPDAVLTPGAFDVE